MEFITFTRDDVFEPREHCGLSYAPAGSGTWFDARLAEEPWLFRIIPQGFGAYARVFHPPYRAVGAGEQPSMFAPCGWGTDADGQPSAVYMREVRWAEVASANGRVAHPTMEWAAITGDWAYRYDDGSQPGIWDQMPTWGSLDQRPTIRLCELLAEHTTTPAQCIFGISLIYSDLPERVLRDAPAAADARLLTGPLFVLADTSFETHRYRSPNLWWPADRAWCVVSNYDLQVTHVAGTDACIDRLVGDPKLEAMRIDPTEPTTDEINPEPRGEYRG